MSNGKPMKLGLHERKTVKIRMMFLFLILCMPMASRAQHPALNMFIGVKKDSVFLFMNKTPGIGEGYIVEMKTPGDTGFARLSEQIILPELNPFSARAALGDYYYQLIRELNLQSEQEVLLKLRTDPFYGQIAMLSNRQAAKILGRFFTVGGITSDEAEFRVSLVTRAERVLEQVTKTIDVIERIPKPVSEFVAKQQDNAIELSWAYPDWRGDHRDLAFQFKISRSTDGQAFVDLPHRLLLRVEGMPLKMIDYTAEKNHTFHYRIVALDAIGLASEPAQVSLKARDVVPPVRPKGLATATEQGKVLLTWNMSLDLDARGYNVYRWIADATDSVQVNSDLIPADTPFFTDSAARLAVNYYYGITCVDSAGNEGPHSNRASVLLTDREPPRAPEWLQAEWHEKKVHLYWPVSASADLAGYRVRRGYDEQESFRLQEELITDTCYVDVGSPEHELEPGRRYYYSVVAIDTMSYPSAAVGCWLLIPDTRPPNAPGRVRVTNDHGREMVIRWNPSLANDLAGYRLWRYEQGDSLLVADLLADQREYADRKILVGSTIYYGVAAIDTAGNQSLPAFSDTVLFRDVVEPTASAFVTAVKTEQGVRIRWEPVGDFDLAGYRLYSSALPTGVGIALNRDLVTELEWLDPNGEVGTWYWVRSVDTSGNVGRKSKPVQAVISPATEKL